MSISTWGLTHSLTYTEMALLRPVNVWVCTHSSAALFGFPNVALVELRGGTWGRKVVPPAESTDEADDQ